MVIHHIVKFGSQGTVVVEIWTFLQIQLFYPKYRISVTVDSHLLPPLLFPLKHMACHAPHASQIKIISYGNFLLCLME